MAENKQVVSMLTTVDNPHHPFNEFDAWLAHDTREKHNTLEYLARIIHTSHEISDADQRLANERAIDEIMEQNVNGLYKRVTIVADD